MHHRGRHAAKGLFMLAALAALGAVVMWLWNTVMPGLFAGSQQIDYWRALGLLVLCRILFGGFRGYGGWQGRQRWQQWQAMTQEEREQLRMQRGFGRCRPGNPGNTGNAGNPGKEQA